MRINDVYTPLKRTFNGIVMHTHLSKVMSAPAADSNKDYVRHAACHELEFCCFKGQI